MNVGVPDETSEKAAAHDQKQRVGLSVKKAEERGEIHFQSRNFLVLIKKCTLSFGIYHVNKFWII